MIETITSIPKLSDEHRIAIQDRIAQLKEEQPKLLKAACVDAGVGWDESGSPDTRKIAVIESAVRSVICADIVIRCAMLIGKSPTPEEIVKITEESSYLYDAIPDAVVNHYAASV